MYNIRPESFSNLIRNEIKNLIWKDFNIEANCDWKYLTAKINPKEIESKTGFYDDELTLEQY